MDASTLINLVDPLLAEESGYITFLEIFEITRIIPEIDFLPSGAIAYLEQLLDHPRLTIGGFKLLDEAINRIYQRILDEWRLGLTAIGYDYSGSTIRLKKGQKFSILLSEEPDGSQEWQTPEVFGPLTLDYEHHFTAENNHHLGYYRCEFIPTACGIAQIKASFLGLGLARKAQKPFTLNIFIEDQLNPRMELDLNESKG